MQFSSAVKNTDLQKQIVLVEVGGSWRT